MMSTLHGLGVEAQVSSGLGRCANTVVYSMLNAGRQIEMYFEDKFCSGSLYRMLKRPVVVIFQYCPLSSVLSGVKGCFVWDSPL